MKKYLFAISTVVAMLSGCATAQKEVKPQNKQQYTDDEIMKKLQYLKEQTHQKKDKPLDAIESEMMTHNPQYAEKHIEQALVENKKDDEIDSKPMFLEPMFAKIEIMPYETKDGIYHEQQSVWIKVKNGEIVLKSNRSQSSVDTYKSVLSK